MVSPSANFCTRTILGGYTLALTKSSVTANVNKRRIYLYAKCGEFITDLFKYIKEHRLFNPVVKITLILVILVMLYYQLSKQQNLAAMVNLFSDRLRSARFGWLLAALALIPINWLTETLKWHLVLKRYEKLPFFKAYQAVLTGVSFSLFTPNRVGEYGGRVLFVSAENRWKAFIINVVGNFAQILVILSFGIVGVIYLYSQSANVQAWLLWSSVVFGLGGIVVLGIAYFNIDIFIPLARRVPYVQRIKRYVKDITVLRDLQPTELRSILFWSVIRYCVYSSQYYAVLHFYGIAPPTLEAYSAIFALFFLQTGVPLPPVLGLVARGSLAVQIFGWWGADTLSALAGTFTLWVINLIFPSLAGLFCVLNLNLARLFGYEKS